MPLRLAPIIRRFAVDVFEFSSLREDGLFVGNNHPVPTQENSTASDEVSAPDGPQAGCPSVCAIPHSLIVLLAALIREERLSVQSKYGLLYPPTERLCFACMPITMKLSREYRRTTATLELGHQSWLWLADRKLSQALNTTYSVRFPFAKMGHIDLSIAKD
jgi:hypothetical protein